MNTPRNTPRPIATPNPENAPTAPPVMLNLLRRRKTLYRLRRMNLVPEVHRPVPVAIEGGAEGAEEAHAEDVARFEKRLAREREARALAEAGAVRQSARIAELEAERDAVRQEAEAQRLRAEEGLKQVEDAKGFVQRARSDMDLQRRRFQKEKDDLQKFAAEEVLRQLFPVLDNFNYAIELVNQGQQDYVNLSKGMGMIHRELMGILGRAGLQTISEAGGHFDPLIHDAASTDVDLEKPNGCVLSVLRPGYRLGDKVLRPAMVVVNRSGVEAASTPVQAAAEELPMSTEAETLPPGAPPPVAAASEEVPDEPVDERLSGLTPLDRARRMLDTKFE